MVSVEAMKTLNRPVTLSQIKSEKKLKEISLIKQSRLSVMPVSDEHWETILSLGQTVL